MGIRRCYDCQDPTPTYMVTNDVWGKAAPGYLAAHLAWLKIPRAEESAHPQPRHLCFPCLENRLGRHLSEGDFTHCKINDPIWVGIRIGKSAVNAKNPKEAETKIMTKKVQHCIECGAPAHEVTESESLRPWGIEDSYSYPRVVCEADDCGFTYTDYRQEDAQLAALQAHGLRV